MTTICWVWRHGNQVVALLGHFLASHLWPAILSGLRNKVIALIILRGQKYSSAAEISVINHKVYCQLCGYYWLLCWISPTLLVAPKTFQAKRDIYCIISPQCQQGSHNTLQNVSHHFSWPWAEEKSDSIKESDRFSFRQPSLPLWRFDTFQWVSLCKFTCNFTLHQVVVKNFYSSFFF